MASSSSPSSSVVVLLKGDQHDFCFLVGSAAGISPPHPHISMADQTDLEYVWQKAFNITEEMNDLIANAKTGTKSVEDIAARASNFLASEAFSKIIMLPPTPTPSLHGGEDAASNNGDRDRRKYKLIKSNVLIMNFLICEMFENYEMLIV